MPHVLQDPPEHARSLWAATAEAAPDAPPLAGDRRADVAIVGGGYTGLSAALHLAEGGADVVAVEAHEIGWGASGRNNGQVVPWLKHDPDDAVRHFGPELGERLVALCSAGPDMVFDLIARHEIACRAERNGVISAAHAASKVKMLERRVEQWQRRGAPIQFLDRQEVAAAVGSERFHAGCIDRRGGAINPLGYARGLARAAQGAGAEIHARSPATRLERADGGWVVTTPGGRITADAVLICTNAYAGGLWPELGRAFVAARTPQIVSRPLGENVRRTILPGGQTLSDTRRLLVGVRMHPDGRLQLGGGGASFGGERQPLYRRLQKLARRLFPQIGDAGWEFAWSGVIAVTPDRYPRLVELAPGLLAGLGYSGRGIVLATAMGRALADRLGGAPLDGLPLPAGPLRPIPGHAAVRPVARALLGYYRLRDALD